MLDKIEKILEEIERPEITMEELLQWRDLPVTKSFLLNASGTYMANLETLNTMIPTCEASRAEHARTVGEQLVLKETLDFYEMQKDILIAKEGQQ